MEITVNLWHVIVVSILAIILILAMTRKGRDILGCILVIIFIFPGILLWVIAIAGLDAYSKTVIHKYAKEEYKQHISLWEGITLKEIPNSELKRRHQDKEDAEEKRKQEYLAK